MLNTLTCDLVKGYKALCPCSRALDMPKRIPGWGLIANVDNWGEAGIHWVCCFHSGPGEFEFFDAEGEPPQ